MGEEVASVDHGRTHNLHGNSLIVLSVAVRPAAHMVTEWTGCADDQRWEVSWRVEAWISLSLFLRSFSLGHLQTPRAALIGLAMN